MADIVAVLYGAVLRVDPRNPSWPDRDRFILSKGHAGAGVYAALAERGFFELSRLEQHYANGSVMSGHVSHKGVPGVELSTGSLGHGLGVACGMAYAARLAAKAHRVVVLMSDGECDEGSNWEAIHFAGHHRLGHLVAVVDYNRIQSLKPTEQTLGLEPFADKWRSFRWDVTEVDGHDHAALTRALSAVKPLDAAPTCILASTTKGKGVSFMENSVLWHYRIPRGEELEAALRELDARP
jgi:transketolase